MTAGVPASARFVEWAWSLRTGDLPAEVRESAACHVLDSLGTALAALRSGEGSPALCVARSFPSVEGATILGTSDKVAPPFAALANGTLVHALDYDDTHAAALVHPSAVVLPVALALAEVRGLDGTAVLTAVVAGIETITRLGAAVTHGFHRRGLHATSVCGVFAAALVAARLGGLTEPQAVDALGIAGSQAAGSLEFLHSGADTKTLHPGLAACSAMLAAQLAGAGARGPATVLEGRNGLFRSYVDADVDAATLTEGLGSRWETPAVGIKAYPVCQLSHASLDALGSILAGRRGPAGGPGLAPELRARVRHIRFAVPLDAVPIVCEPVADKLRPRTPYEAKFSLPWCAATLLVDGRIDIDSFTPERLDRPEVAVLAGAVSFDATKPGVPAADAPGEAEVVLDDGQVLRATVPQARGTAGNPLPAEDLVAKFVANAGRRADAQHVARAVLDLARADRIDRLLVELAALVDPAPAKEPV